MSWAVITICIVVELPFLYNGVFIFVCCRSGWDLYSSGRVVETCFLIWPCISMSFSMFFCCVLWPWTWYWSLLFCYYHTLYVDVCYTLLAFSSVKYYVMLLVCCVDDKKYWVLFKWMEYKRLTGFLVCSVDLSCQSALSTVMYTVCL